MKKVIFVFALGLYSSFAFAQEPTPTQVPVEGTNISGTPYRDLPLQKRSAAELFAPLVAAQSNGYSRPDAKTRRKRFVNSMVGPFALGKMVATAGIATWRNSPEEWGPTWEGFGRRVASNFGKNAIKQTTKFGLDEAFKLDSQYYRSKSKSVGARVTNALVSPVTARNRNGKRVVGFPNLVGTYGSSIIAYETWYPSRYDWKHGVRSGTISLGFNAAFNLIKEFIWKK